MADKNKARFDCKITVSELEPGDRVLVRNVRLRGKNKLADKREADIHVVVKRACDLPVYTVKPESKQGPSRTLHRDLLLPCSFLSGATAEVSVPARVSRPKTPRTTATENTSPDESVELEIDNGLLSPWVENSPCQEITRFTTVHDYSKPPNITKLINMTKPLDWNLPDCDQSETAANADLELRKNGKQEGANEDEPLETLLEVDQTENGVGNPPQSPDKSEENERITPESTPKDSIEEQKNDLPEGVDSNPNPVTTQPLRRSERNRQPPKRLDYPNLGNPLVTVVKSLFQGLSAAFTDSLNTNDGQYWLNMQQDVHGI